VSRSAISLTTGLEDPENVTVALLVAVGCEACPAITDLMERFEAAGGELLACPICFKARQLEESRLVPNARLGGTVQLWEWIGDGATTFSY
jgi:hypothetical protein